MDEATRIKYEKVNMAVQNISTRKKNLQDITSIRVFLLHFLD